MMNALAGWIAAGGDSGNDEKTPERLRHAPQTFSSHSANGAVDPANAELVESLRASDERSFETLYLAHAKAIAAYIISVTHLPSDVQDIVQETYMALWHRRDTLTPSDHIVGFLYRTARNIALTRVRHIQVVTRVEASAHDVPPGIAGGPIAADLQMDIDERHHQLAAALQALPERQRLAIQLRFYEEMPYADIGEILGVGEKAAFMLVSRAVTALRPVAALFVAQANTP